MWSSDSPPPTYSVPPAVGGKVAATFGARAFGRYHLALLHAYFAEHRTISDRHVLVAVAGETGLPTADFDDRLAARGDDLAREVLTEHVEAIESGIHAVPAVVANGRYLVTGAVELDDYRRLITRLQADEPGATGP